MADQQEASSSRVVESSSTLASSHEGESPAAEPQKKCASCGKVETVTDPEEQPVLKHCAKCHTTLYCSRDCTKSDFKQHKKVCAKQAQAYAESADFKPSAPRRAPPKENFRGGLQKWQFDT
ncbi:uncharacterized protein RCC_02133 [Ramularia collo-cygni]|uniref:MYND-type domain-containing protein n=1 Tax=Ramularia collo-cygni TaxID=112498 RepID=A0A2D3UNC9_9PEZI|nr:uncharacterized protein RCC_02133 [Ramularia collo-cygni]CZT16291.1 uncharacterized protein RCC_02133 [Ramularia collo-cygni]